MSIPSKKSGYTLLFAVLISVLILGVAVFMSGIARKEYILSSTALDSMYSFYAADSGIECVMYPQNLLIASTTGSDNLTCNGYIISHPNPANSGDYTAGPDYLDPNGATRDSSERATFNLDFGTIGGCAVITIDTYNTQATETSSSTVITVVTSRGYNLCTGSGLSVTPDKTSPRTVERALQTTVI